jgi:hypothetical protein
MGQKVRRFVFKSDEDVKRFMEFMRANRKPLAQQGRFLQVIVSEYFPDRTVGQNAYMWGVLLTPAAQQVHPGGQEFEPESWNRKAKELFLPEINAKGMSKWRYLENGDRELAMSTSDLDENEMNEYLQKLEAWLVTEWNVHIPADPRNF